MWPGWKNRQSAHTDYEVTSVRVVRDAAIHTARQLATKHNLSTSQIRWILDKAGVHAHPGYSKGGIALKPRAD